MKVSAYWLRWFSGRKISFSSELFVICNQLKHLLLSHGANTLNCLKMVFWVIINVVTQPLSNAEIHLINIW